MKNIIERWEKITPSEIADNLIDQPDDFPLTEAAHRAASYSKDPEVLKVLFQNGWSPNTRNQEGLLPIHCAAKNNANPEIIQIIKEFSDPIHDGQFGEFTTPQWAVLYNTLPVVQYSFTEKAELQILTGEKETLLHLAAGRNKDPAVIDFLMEQNLLDVQARDIWGMTPLHHAAGWNEPTIVERLIDHGADKHAKDYSGYSPACYAQEFNSNPQNIQTLLQTPDNPEFDGQQTPDDEEWLLHQPG